MKHFHILIVSLFLLNLTIKAVLLISNSPQFASFRAKTKIVEMVLGTLVLVTGGIVWYKSGLGFGLTWLNIKMALVLTGIPLAIIGMKKGSKALVMLSLCIFLYVFAVAWTKDLTLCGPACTSTTCHESAN